MGAFPECRLIQRQRTGKAKEASTPELGGLRRLRLTPFGQDVKQLPLAERVSPFQGSITHGNGSQGVLDLHNDRVAST